MPPKESMMPHDLEAERALLGCLLMDAQAIDEVAPLLVAEDFYRPLHIDIYKHICRLHDAGELVDTVTLYHALHDGSKDQDESLLSYLIGLTNAEVFSLVGAEQYARRVSQDAKRRKLIRFGAHVVQDAHADPDADATLEKAEAGLFEIAKQGHFSEWATLSEVAADYFDRFTLLQQHRGQIGGVPTGFRALDFYLGGLSPKDMVVVAGRPGTGKSSFALSIAYNAAFKHQKKIAIFSLEMSKDELFGRLLSMRARVDGQRLRMPWLLGVDELERIEQAKCDLCSDHLFIDETPSLNTTLLRSKARRLRAKEGVDLVIIDYLQLMEAYVDGKRIRERHLEVAEISKAIKSLAKELEVPILALAQLNRDVESRASKVPQLSDLKECVVGSTRLIDAKTGKWVPIAQIQPGDEVLGLGKQQTIERFAVQDVWRTGTKPVFCLTTRTGRQLIASANHPLLTAQGWKRLDELTAGDCIATALRLPEHGQEVPERADLCRLLGYLVGDGTYLKHCGIGFISSDPETLEDVLCIVATHFPGVMPRHVKREGRAQEVYFTCLCENGYGKPYANPLREWLRTLELVGQRDNTKHVPAWVFEAGKVGAREFLAGYLSADGCVKVETRRGHTTWRIHFETVSYRFACDIQALLLRIGVVSTINDGSFQAKSTQPLYRVGVSSCADNLKRFAEQVPARGKKGRALQQLLQELLNEQTTPGVFGLPVEVSAYLAAHAHWRDQGKCMRRDVCLEWAERLDDPVLREWGMSDLLWEEIRRIEPRGEAEVFDICIPACHNFLANGIVAHNSGQIEQDCDAVLFLYSEEMHNPNTDRKGQVDVIIAKHRHGPIGEVALHFEKRYTQFSNLEVKR